MKKKTLLRIISGLYFVAAFVMTFLFFSLTEPSESNLFVGSMIFLVCILGSVFYRSAAKSVLVLIVVSSLILTSCSRKGYGCKGRESWNSLIKRNNKPY
jgi:hypothetical protein